MSKRWLKEHFSDQYVKKAQATGYISRAAYKLLALEEKDYLFKRGMTVVDLGAAPGGWSQVSRELVGDKGTVIALDILPMDPISGVTFIQGDFREDAVLQQLLDTLGDRKADLVISDMAPNLSGNKSIDQPRSMYLVELAWDCAQQILRPGGTFLTKVFQGEGVDKLIQDLRLQFEVVKSRKPDASQARSREFYLLSKGFLGYTE